MVVTSLVSRNGFFNSTRVWIPEAISPSFNYKIAWELLDYGKSITSTLKYEMVSALIEVAACAVTAYGFARCRTRGRNLLFFVYIIIMLMPHQVTLVPNFLVSKYLGILETRWAIILPGIFSPFAVFILTKAMRRVPKNIIEAARLDGAGEWKIFTKICLPECKSAMFSVIILVFIDYWNMVEQVLVLLTDPEKQPLSIFLSKINVGEISLAFAVATIYMIPAILLFLHGEEHLVEGISYSGGLKG